MTLNVLVSLQYSLEWIMLFSLSDLGKKREIKVYNLTSFGKTQFDDEANF